MLVIVMFLVVFLLEEACGWRNDFGKEKFTCGGVEGQPPREVTHGSAM